MTQSLYLNIIKELRANVSIKSVSQRLTISSNTITMVFGLIDYKSPSLPSVLAIKKLFLEFRECKDSRPDEKVLMN